MRPPHHLWWSSHAAPHHPCWSSHAAPHHPCRAAISCGHSPSPSGSHCLVLQCFASCTVSLRTSLSLCSYIQYSATLRLYPPSCAHTRSPAGLTALFQVALLPLAAIPAPSTPSPIQCTAKCSGVAHYLLHFFQSALLLSSGLKSQCFFELFTE